MNTGSKMNLFQHWMLLRLNKVVQLPVINKAGHISRSCGINHVADGPYSLNSFPINLRSNVKQVTAVTTWHPEIKKILISFEEEIIIQHKSTTSASVVLAASSAWHENQWVHPITH
jgi:hypothetical protein